MTQSNVILWALAAAAASALAFPGGWVLLALVPVAVAAVAALWPSRPRHAAAAAPVYVSATITQVWLYGPGAATGSMDLTAELAWRRRYEIPDTLSPHTMECGSGPPTGAPAPRPYLLHFDARPPARLAPKRPEYRADLEHQAAEHALNLRRVAEQAAAIRAAARMGWQ